MKREEMDKNLLDLQFDLLEVITKGLKSTLYRIEQIKDYPSSEFNLNALDEYRKLAETQIGGIATVANEIGNLMRRIGT